MNDIREALVTEIKATEEKLDRLKAALRALDGRESAPKPRHRTAPEHVQIYEETAPQALLEIMKKNFGPGVDIPTSKVKELAIKFHDMPLGTISSALWHLKDRGLIRHVGVGIYRLPKK
jgi:hypothetical protein